MFRKLVAIEPIGLIPEAEKMLYSFAKEVILYNNIPTDNDTIVERIGNADAVLLSYTTTLTRDIIERCPQIVYIGMCCSLYSPESANVDIHYAESRGITVTGIRDYGDEGVVEYVISELVRILHGFGQEPWKKIPYEITGLNVGIVGLGKSGGMIADALSFLGANIRYFARTPKKDAENKGYRFLSLNELLKQSEVVFCCLNKNTILLHKEEFASLGNHKILFNTGLSPAWEKDAFENWIEGDNLCYCDTVGALGGEKLLSHPNIHCMNVSTGRTKQAFDRLSNKVIANIEAYLNCN